MPETLFTSRRRPTAPGHRAVHRRIAVVGLAVTATLAAAVGAAVVGPTSSADAATPAAAHTSAVAQLATLPVKGKAPKTGYARTADFGRAWLDVDHNGCDTRDDILRRDLTDPVGSGPCTVTAGTLVSPYTGGTIDFVRGVKTSSLVQIDHVVALEDAWQTGAQQLTLTQREALANDPLNLIAVDRHSNEQKGDGDAATWLPAAKSFRCDYVAHQVAVKAKYSLWVTPAEHDAMGRILGSCVSQPVATPTSLTTPTSSTAAAGAAASPSAVVAGLVPAVVGRNDGAAKRAVVAAALHFVYVAPHHQHVHVASNWLVVSQSPAASKQVAAGSTVTVHLKHKSAARLHAEHAAAKAAAAATKAAAVARAARAQAIVDAQVKAYNDAKAAAATKAKAAAIVAARVKAYHEAQAAAAAKAAADAAAAKAADQAATPAAPAAPAAPSGGPTAICRDGSTSYSQHHSGTCSHHGGVQTWL